MLRGKVALITGSTSGIGLGMAHVFAKNHAHVIINGLGSKEDIDKIIKELQELNKAKVLYLDADMSKSADIEAMVKKAGDEFGGIDILVNNVGIQFVSPLEDFPNEKWEAIMAINLSAAFYTTKAVFPHMKEKKWGRIINISSAHGLVASPFKSAYVSAKHGLI